MRVPSMQTIRFLWRLLAAAALLVLAYEIFVHFSSKSMLGAFGGLLFAAAAFIASAVIVSPDLARLGARPFTAFIDSIYFPGGRSKTPPHNFHKADLYYRTRRYEMAEEALGEIIRDHPDVLTGYLKMSEVCLRLDDPAAALKVLDMAHRRFRNDMVASG